MYLLLIDKLIVCKNIRDVVHVVCKTNDNRVSKLLFMMNLKFVLNVLRRIGS